MLVARYPQFDAQKVEIVCAAPSYHRNVGLKTRSSGLISEPAEGDKILTFESRPPSEKPLAGRIGSPG